MIMDYEWTIPVSSTSQKRTEWSFQDVDPEVVAKALRFMYTGVAPSFGVKHGRFYGIFSDFLWDLVKWIFHGNFRKF